MATKNTTLLLLAGAGIGAYLLLNKSTTTTTISAAGAGSLTDVVVSPTDVAAAAAATGVSTTVIAAAAAASAAMLANAPDDLGQLAITASTDLLTTLAIVWHDAIINKHPNEYSTKYFLASEDTWNSAVTKYNESRLPELARNSSLDQVAVLVVAFYDAQVYGHPEWLSTQYFLASRETWQAALVRYQQKGGISGLAGGNFSPQFATARPALLPAVALTVAPAQRPAWA